MDYQQTISSLFDLTLHLKRRQPASKYHHEIFKIFFIHTNIRRKWRDVTWHLIVEIIRCVCVFCCQMCQSCCTTIPLTFSYSLSTREATSLWSVINNDANLHLAHASILVLTTSHAYFIITQNAHVTMSHVHSSLRDNLLYWHIWS